MNLKKTNELIKIYIINLFSKYKDEEGNLIIDSIGFKIKDNGEILFYSQFEDIIHIIGEILITDRKVWSIGDIFIKNNIYYFYAKKQEKNNKRRLNKISSFIEDSPEKLMAEIKIWKDTETDNYHAEIENKYIKEYFYDEHGWRALMKLAEKMKRMGYLD